jgi:electron transport complex protein RnfG
VKESLKLVFVLAVICTVAGLALAVVYNLTYEPIQIAKAAEKLDAIDRVLPKGDEGPVEQWVTNTTTGTSNLFYLVRGEGKFLGAAIEATSHDGYAGDIVLMVGFNHYGDVEAIDILSQSETPGLGAKIDTPDFKNRFAGRKVSGTKWKVVKDGGDIDAITAATISSRAVTEAVAWAAQQYREAREFLLAQDDFVIEPLEGMLQ